MGRRRAPGKSRGFAATSTQIRRAIRLKLLRNVSASGQASAPRAVLADQARQWGWTQRPNPTVCCSSIPDAGERAVTTREDCGVEKFSNQPRTPPLAPPAGAAWRVTVLRSLLTS